MPDPTAPLVQLVEPDPGAERTRWSAAFTASGVIMLAPAMIRVFVDAATDRALPLIIAW